MTNIALPQSAIKVLAEASKELDLTIYEQTRKTEEAESQFNSAKKKLDSLQLAKSEIDALLASQPTN